MVALVSAPCASDVKLDAEPTWKRGPPRVASRETQEVGVAGHVVCAQPFFKNDGMGIALQKLTQTRFEALQSSKDESAGQFSNLQVEQVVDIPVQFLLAGGFEVSVSKTDGFESPEHFLPDSVRFVPAASGGVADQAVGQRRGASLRHRRPDVDVLSRQKLYGLSALESAELKRGMLRQANPQNIRPTQRFAAQEDERGSLRILVKRFTIAAHVGTPDIYESARKELLNSACFPASHA